MAVLTEARETSRSAALFGRYRESLGILVGQVLFGLAVLAIWEWASGRLIDTFFVSKPTLIAANLWTSLLNGSLMRDIGVTLQETIIGFAGGSILGIAGGLALAQMTRVAAVLNPYILAIYGVPRIALAPLFIIWFGIGIWSKIYLAGLMAFFLAFFNTYTGIGSVDIGLKSVARVMGANKWQVMYKVVLPAASPWIIAGLRVSIPYALVAAVVGEMIMSTAGLGYRIISSTQTFDITGTMSGVVVLMLIVMVANYLLDKVESYILRWRPKEGPSQSAGGGP